MSGPAIAGWCAPGYESVGEAFTSCFAELGETGGELTCMLDGEMVVDVHGGWKDSQRTHEWTASFGYVTGRIADHDRAGRCPDAFDRIVAGDP